MLETVIKENTLKKVAERTKISERNLQKLVNREFGGLPRPQAFGFVAIIEREFGVDLSALREEMNHFYQNRPTQTGEPIFSREDLPSARRQGGGAGWAVLGIVLLLVGAGYYYYQNSVKQTPSKEAEISKALAEAERNMTATPSFTQAETEAQKVEAEAQESQNQAAAPAEPNTQEADDAKTKRASEPEPEPYVPLDPVIVEPTVKLWLGIIDLKTHKRRVKIIQRPFDIDSHGKKLLLTGHGRFEISDGEGNIIKLNDAKKHYFLIENGVLQEIDEGAFRRYNGGKGW